MAKKSYEEMSDEELSLVRIDLDAQIEALRAEKKKIQEVVDSRVIAAVSTPPGYVLRPVGIASSEAVGTPGGK